MSTELQDLGFMPVAQHRVVSNTVGTALASEEARIKAQIVMAMQHPRNVPASVQVVLDDCKRPKLAEAAIYRFRRGGEMVTGPSVDLARAMASAWGHVDSGYTIIEDTETNRQIRCYAHDLCTGRRVTADLAFRKAIQRKDRATGVTVWEHTDDQRLIREETAKWAAIGERNCILQIIPSDVTDAALERCEKTLLQASNATLERNRNDVVRDLVDRFSRLSSPVTVEMLEKYLEHPLSEISAQEVVHLKSVGKAILDGNATREEFFELSPVHSSRAAGPLDSMFAAPQGEREVSDESVVDVPEGWEPDPEKMVDSKVQMPIISAARQSGDLSGEALAGWRKAAGLGKGGKMNQVQAADLIRQIQDGSIARFERDGVE